MYDEGRYNDTIWTRLLNPMYDEGRYNDTSGLDC